MVMLPVSRDSSKAYRNPSGLSTGACAVQAAAGNGIRALVRVGLTCVCFWPRIAPFARVPTVVSLRPRHPSLRDRWQSPGRCTRSYLEEVFV